MAEESARLLMFYGTECEHCHDMMPIVEELEKKESVNIEKLEVWHNETNMNLFQKYDDGKCGSIPFFYNEKTTQWICGLANPEKLKEWALA